MNCGLERMVAWWKEDAKPLIAFFGDKPLRKITHGDLSAYQNARKRHRPRPEDDQRRELGPVTAPDARQAVVRVRRGVQAPQEDEACRPGDHRRRAGHLFTVAKSRQAWVFA